MSGQEAGKVLDLSKWHDPITWLGPGEDGDTEYALQNGVIFAWSESNLRYESAWWLNPDGSKATDPAIGRQRMIDKVYAERPFNMLWKLS